MRHGKKFNHLGRKVGHRKALLQNLSISLIEHKRISTTLAKAKALRTFVEPIITTAKDNSQHAHREAFRKLQNKRAVTELFTVVAPKVGDRPGGYVRVIRTGTRLGDNAETALIELVDFNETYNATDKSGGKTRRRRRRRGGSGSGNASATNASATNAASDATATDETGGAAADATVADASDAVIDTAATADLTADVTDATPTGEVIADALVEEANDESVADATVAGASPEAAAEAPEADDEEKPA